jgi:hypothetical protein
MKRNIYKHQCFLAKKTNLQCFYKRVLVFTISCSCSLLTVGKAIADGEETNTENSQTSEVQLPLTNPQTAGSLTITPTTLQQTGTNNFANVNSNVGALERV